MNHSKRNVKQHEFVKRRFLECFLEKWEVKATVEQKGHNILPIFYGNFHFRCHKDDFSFSTALRSSFNKNLTVRDKNLFLTLPPSTHSTSLRWEAQQCNIDSCNTTVGIPSTAVERYIWTHVSKLKLYGVNFSLCCQSRSQETPWPAFLWTHGVSFLLWRL